MWSEKYAAGGLTIVGVHGYDFTGQTPVAEGVRDYKMTYPVVDDTQKAVWKAYGITSRPSWAVIGKDGALVQRGVGSAITPQVQGRIEAALR